MQRIFVDLADPDYEYVRTRVRGLSEHHGALVSTVALDEYFRRLIDKDRDDGSCPVVIEIDHDVMELLGKMSEREDEALPDIAKRLMIEGLATEMQG